MRTILLRSIVVCLLYGTSSFFFSFVCKFLFKIYHFNSFFLLIFLETLIDLVVSSGLIYMKEIKSVKYYSLEEMKSICRNFFQERYQQFRETYLLSLFFLLNNVFGVKGLSQVSIPIFLALKRTLIFYVLVINYFMGSAKKVISQPMIAAIVLITMGALLMGYNDLEGNLSGYINMSIHNTLTAVTLELSKSLNTQKEMSPLNIVFNTGFNCLPLAFLMFFFSNDYTELYEHETSYQNAFYLCLGIVLAAAFLHHYLTFLCATENSPFAIALTHNIKDLFSTTAGIMYFNDLKLDFVVLTGLAVSFLGAFLFSFLKVLEIQEFKARSKKDEEKEDVENSGKEARKSQDFVVFVIDPQPIKT